ncbi:uroporphyrinogen-III C-methyltransferase [uncultured Vibrio sp.]|uniref:uroporphyrinogen-III C-methyltransferase n=1 Tax=uncultured Vibrio sp. TaxID=114054 RepID=UPI0009136E70|nr:uroporphyrinogen-III C-methyltransferase [uncultured Vibrio sp.]OIQ24392.1 MAG: heme biosynthesis operon protein HemX [Vibrio sp. MedPE-SWchi]
MTNKKDNQHIEPENKTTTIEPTTETKETSEVEVSDNKTKSNVKGSSASQSTSDPKGKNVGASPKPKGSEPGSKKKSNKLGIAAIIISILIGGALTYKIQTQNDLHQSQLSALKAELIASQSALSERLQEEQKDVIKQASQISHRSEVSINQQQKSIESLQLAMADVKGRRPNDWLLAEADYLVKLAGRKLFLEQDVLSATQLIESADQRIASLNDPSLVPLRKAMANDITQLKTVPIIDRDGLVLRLTALQQQVDTLPLANAILPEAQVIEKPVVSQDIVDWQKNLMTSIKDFSENFITYRTRDGNVIPLLSPEQDFYLRENIKAKLETAIRATYAEQEEVYTIALTTANQWAQAFFNVDDNGVKEFNASVEFLGKQNIQVDYPTKLTTQNILSDVINERLRREVTTLTLEDK